MKRKRPNDPRWVCTVLDWPVTWLLARLALISAFLIGGVTKALNFSAAIAEQNHFGLHPAPVWAILSIIVELAGPMLVVSGYFVWLGAGALGVLTAIAAIVATPFWSLVGAARIDALNGFFERTGLIAGFVLVAMLTSHANRGWRRTDIEDN